MTPHIQSRRMLAGLVISISAVALCACSGPAPGELGESQRMLATCPDDQPIDSFVLVDGSASGLNDAIADERLTIIEDVARRTAVCGGTLTVQAFSSGSGATITIYDDEIVIAGATDNARLRRVPDAVVEVMKIVTDAYQPALAGLPSDGTDITGIYRLLGEQLTQRPSARLEAIVLTDGLNNLGVNTEVTRTPEQATVLADQVAVPQLPGASITVAGLGRVAGDPLPSNVIDGLVAFYNRLCANTGADQCLSVTDWR